MTQSLDLITHHLSSSEVLPELVKDVLSKRVECRFRAKGYSMSPFIKDGDVITLSSLQGDLPRIGDVVAFIHPVNDKLVIHRVIEKRNGSYCVMGDNALGMDGLIPANNILGCVKEINRDGKNLRIGLGPERFLIAFLNRRGLLFPLLVPVWKLIRPLVRRWVR